jgi:hypothetical protein
MLRLENKVDNVNDVAILTCYAVDAAGRIVPNAAPYVEFHTNKMGRILGTGSDVCDHSPLPEPKRRMRAGAIGVAVGVATERGKRTAESSVIEVYANAEGMRGAKLCIPFEADKS